MTISKYHKTFEKRDVRVLWVNFRKTFQLMYIVECKIHLKPKNTEFFIKEFSDVSIVI